MYYQRQSSHGSPINFNLTIDLGHDKLRYLTLNAVEKRLLIQGLPSFRNKIIAKGINAVDIDWILKRIMK